MKKFSAILVALVMMLALCIPAFAGDAINALTDTNAIEVATAIEEYIAVNPNASFADAATRAALVDSVTSAVTVANYGDNIKNAISIDLAVEAVKADYSDLLTDEDAESLKNELLTALQNAYAERPGISTFDPSQIADNIAGGFTENDLSGLFDTMRNTITDLSDRLSNVFSGLGGGEGGNDGTDSTDNSDNSSANNGADNSFGASEPTGDTAIYAVAGVAAVAAVALVLTKKKSTSK